jgi:hypothetical protein
VEIGMVFAFINVVTGLIWAHRSEHLVTWIRA